MGYTIKDAEAFTIPLFNIALKGYQAKNGINAEANKPITRNELLTLMGE